VNEGESRDELMRDGMKEKRREKARSLSLLTNGLSTEESSRHLSCPSTDDSNSHTTSCHAQHSLSPLSRGPKGAWSHPSSWTALLRSCKLLFSYNDLMVPLRLWPSRPSRPHSLTASLLVPKCCRIAVLSCALFDYNQGVHPSYMLAKFSTCVAS